MQVATVAAASIFFTRPVPRPLDAAVTGSAPRVAGEAAATLPAAANNLLNFLHSRLHQSRSD